MGAWAGHFGTLMPYYRAAEKLPRMEEPTKEPKKVRGTVLYSACSTVRAAVQGLRGASCNAVQRRFYLHGRMPGGRAMHGAGCTHA